MIRHVRLLPLAVALAACASRSPVQREMLTHYQRVGEVQAALIRGDLATARAAARWVAEHDEVSGLPDAGTPWLAAMRSEARAVVGASTEVLAAGAAARMGKTCGDCHRAVRQGPRMVVMAPPPETRTAMSTHVVRHQWAADRMWDGLIGPSDSAWNAGAAVLGEQPIYQADVGMRTGRFAEAEEMAQRVVALGYRARASADGFERASIYGEFLASCAACHTAVGVRHPPAR